MRSDGGFEWSQGVPAVTGTPFARMTDGTLVFAEGGGLSRHDDFGGSMCGACLPESATLSADADLCTADTCVFGGCKHGPPELRRRQSVHQQRVHRQQRLCGVCRHFGVQRRQFVHGFGCLQGQGLRWCGDLVQRRLGVRVGQLRWVRWLRGRCAANRQAVRHRQIVCWQCRRTDLRRCLQLVGGRWPDEQRCATGHRDHSCPHRAQRADGDQGADRHPGRVCVEWHGRSQPAPGRAVRALLSAAAGRVRGPNCGYLGLDTTIDWPNAGSAPPFLDGTLANFLQTGGVGKWKLRVAPMTTAGKDVQVKSWKLTVSGPCNGAARTRPCGLVVSRPHPRSVLPSALGTVQVWLGQFVLAWWVASSRLHSRLAAPAPTQSVEPLWSGPLAFVAVNRRHFAVGPHVQKRLDAPVIEAVNPSMQLQRLTGMPSALHHRRFGQRQHLFGDV